MEEEAPFKNKGEKIIICKTQKENYISSEEKAQTWKGIDFWTGTQIVYMSVLSKLIYKRNALPIKISGFFKTGKLIPKFL